MSKLVKYFVYGGQPSFFEFDLDYTAAGISLRGSEVLYTGGAGVETVYAARGISFDFTNASGQVDRLYLNASLSDYSLGRQGTNLLLTENASGSVIKVLAGNTLSFDRVVFTDGMASSKALYDAAGSGAAPGLDAATKTPANKSDLYAAMGTLPEASIKAFAATNEGVTFGAAPKGGATLIATGGSGVDIVYVAAWSKVDAVDLSGGVDRIYLTGSFSEYARSIQGTTLVLSRAEGSNSETVKINGGSTLAFDRVIFADGAARSVDLFNAAKNNTAPPVLDPTLVTPGLAPALKASALSNIEDLDVRSNLVFQLTEDVTPQAGKFIRIINDANSSAKAGLYGENTNNSFLIDVTDSRVQIANGRVTVNPDRDLDFSNNYHIEIDAGAFVGKVTGKPNLAVSDPGALKFSTVTPGSDKSVSSSQGLSRMMQADGTLADSQIWKDVEGWPNGKTGGQATLDLSDKKIALVTADLLPTTSFVDLSGEGQSRTNIETGDFNLRLSNFGADDLIYMDDLGRNNENSENALQLIFGPQFNSSGGSSRFNFDNTPGKAGGAIEIVGQAFADLAQWQQLVGGSQAPFVFGSVAVASPPADTTPPTLQSAP
ncbi:MAG: hypothetical protein ING33_10290, partial [Rhodocyclaceae bacterium]|nr:hypothetical protein [Rhodocyclaceae bacterium]